MSWLFIARYNHNAWKDLSVEEEDAARAAARTLFPYGVSEQALTSPVHFTFVDTFQTAVFSRLPSNYTTLTKAERTQVMDEIFATLPTGDKRIGWVAIVPDNQVASLKMYLGDEQTGTDEPLKRMYIIESIPLNDNQTTAEIYEYMTPSHWS